MSRHPGKLLHDSFMKPLGISASQLARSLGMNRSTLGRLIAGEQRMTLQMAARLGAYFDVPARWWLAMQTEHDAHQIDAHPELSAGVRAMTSDPDVLLTPKGVLRLSGDGAAPEELATSLPRAELESLPPGADPERRAARVVRHDNGAVALVGDDL